jgi:hypothetical protein
VQILAETMPHLLENVDYFLKTERLAFRSSSAALCALCPDELSFTLRFRLPGSLAFPAAGTGL